jgi:hypothetical protein
MSLRAPKYGLDKDLAQLALDKYDHEAEEEAKEWIEAIVGRSIGPEFGPGLKDGVILCELANALNATPTIKISTSSMPFKQMENVTAFIRFCRTTGVTEFDLFETLDLFETKDLGAVVRCLHALGRTLQKNPSFKGPFLGVKEATKNQRTFSDKQLSEARNAVSLVNMGSQATMRRTQVSAAGSVTFGANAASQLQQSSSSTADSSKDTATSSLGQLERTPSPATSSLNNCSIPAPVQVRGGGYGLDAELAAKAQEKYDYDLESEVVAWIEAITEQTLREKGFGPSLKDGSVLCMLINALRMMCEGGVDLWPEIKIETSSIAFKQMQNIKHFLTSCRAVGVAEFDCFETVDLFELKDLSAVLRCLMALHRAVLKKFPGYQGPVMQRALVPAASAAMTSSNLQETTSMKPTSSTIATAASPSSTAEPSAVLRRGLSGGLPTRTNWQS